MEETSKYINIISFTEKGEALAKRLSIYLSSHSKRIKRIANVIEI